MKNIIIVLNLIFLASCTHTSPLVENAAISEVVKISTESEYAVFGIAYATDIQKILDFDGNLVMDEPAFTTMKNAVLPEGKYEIVVRCHTSSFFTFRSIRLDTKKGNEYVLQCVEGRVKAEAALKLVETKKLVSR